MVKYLWSDDMKIIRISAIWCPSCLAMNKIWKQITSEYSDVEIIKYDYDIDEDMVKKYNIGTVLPVIIFLDDNNEEVNRLVGETSYNDIVKLIEVTINEKI